jgi:hypothetical protein
MNVPTVRANGSIPNVRAHSYIAFRAVAKDPLFYEPRRTQRTQRKTKTLLN